MRKIKLERPRLSIGRQRMWRNDLIVTAAPPYVYSNHSSRAHRIRTATIYNIDCDAPHTAYNCWCGQTFLQSARCDKRGKVVTLTDNVPDSLPICATCEGRAIGAGQDQSKTINGREVIFSPRKDRR